MAASVPEEVIRSICTEGIRRATSSARSISIAVGAPKVVPLAAVRVTASRISGWACPWMSGPQEQT